MLLTLPLLIIYLSTTNRAGSGQSPTRNLACGPRIWSGPTRPEPHFKWPDPALYYALLTEKLVKNGSKYVKISGPNPTQAQYGQPEPDPGQKKSGPTQPYKKV